jgi:hypothetical protein
LPVRAKSCQINRSSALRANVHGSVSPVLDLEPCFIGIRKNSDFSTSHLKSCDFSYGFASIDYAAYAAERPAVRECGLYGRFSQPEAWGDISHMAYGKLNFDSKRAYGAGIGAGWGSYPCCFLRLWRTSCRSAVPLFCPAA